MRDDFETRRAQLLCQLVFQTAPPVEIIQALARNLATEALHMMGRRTCPFTGNAYFLDPDAWKGLLWIK